METKKVTIQFEHKGSRALEESTIQTSLENIEKLFAECDSELGSMGMDGCGYVSQASQISELYEHIQDLKNYVWSAHQEVYDVLDHPLFLDFSNGVTQALSEIVLANFQTENTIGMEEYVDVTKQGHAITHKEVKKSLGFTDFLGLSEIDPREGLPALENVETVSEFALLFRLDYDIMKEETDVNTAMQGFLTAGEFPHLSYDTETGYISGLLDFTIIVPLTEAITGYNQVTGEKLTGSERGWKVAGAVVDIISLGLGAKFLKAGGYAGKELLKKLGITFLQDTASGVGAYTVAYAASENGASGVDTFLISMLTGTVLSAVMGKPVFDEKILKETPEVVGESTEVVIKGGADLVKFNIDEIRPQLKTEPDTAFFWSGKTDGVGGAEVAADIAKGKGGVTLESTIEAKDITMPEWDFNDPSSMDAWDMASAAYAEQVSGEVRAVVGTELRPDNIWENVELPRLMENPNVTKITIIDPKTGIETVIFER